MMKTIRPFRFGTLLIFFAMIYGLQSFMTPTPPAPPEQIIEYKGKPDRFLVFLTEEIEAVSLCGLEKEETYLVNVIPAYGEDGVFTTFINPGPGGLSYGKIKAEAPCQTLVIKTQTKKVFEKIPVYISVSRTTDTYSVKPVEPGRPPAISTSTSTPLSELITGVLIGGDCFEVMNVTAQGTNNQRGTFNNGLTSVGIASGVILSSGNIATAAGPNNSGSAGTSYNQNAGDVDLAQIAGGVIRDASKIEFDFTPTNDTVTFRYVFASEEYCEWVGSGFNDVFGFFISGPGITGPFSNNAQNIAKLPNGTQVSINNVNHNSNSTFYVPNIPAPIPNDPDCAGHPVAGPPSTQDCQYDGFTAVLTATAVVIPCSTYHIKLAVADVGDYIYDSAVFLEANSFAAGTLAGATANGTVQGTNIIYEGCTGGYFLFVRDGDLSLPMTITYTISGTATPGADYTPLTTSVTIPAGQSQVELPVNAILDNIAEGTETIILEFALPCQCSQKQVIMQIKDPPPINMNLPDQTLCGSQSVTLNPGATGGVPPLSYLWSTGATTSSITVTPPIGTTTYNVTVTDDCGHTAVESANVTINEAPTATLSGSGVLCTQGNQSPVDLTINFTGSAPWQFVYSLNGVQTTITTSDNPYILSISQPGSVSLVSVLSTSGNCAGTVSGNVTITQTTITATTQTTNPGCNGGNTGSINLNVSNGTSPYTYIWSNGNTTEDPSGLAAGTYTVTVTDANGCEQTASATLTDPPALTASTNSVNPGCNGASTGSIDLTVGGGTSPYTYNWSNGNTIQDPNNLPAGTYSVTVTDAHGCTQTASVTLSEPPDLTASATGTDPPCNGTNTGSINLTVGGGTPAYTYLWSNGSNLQNPANLPAGAYTVTVTDSHGCTEVTSVTLSQPPQLTASATGTPPTCNGGSDGSINLTVGGGTPTFTYLWSNGNNTQNPANLPAGTYTVTVTDANGCTKTTSVTLNNPPQINATTQVINPGCNGANTGSINLSVSSGTSPYTFLWSNGSTLQNPTGLGAGAYTVTVTDANGCTKVASASLVDPPLLNASVANVQQVDCAHPSGSITTSVSGGTPGYSYQWSPSGSGPNPTGLPAGTYTATVTDANGCTTTITATVNSDLTPPSAAAAVNGILTCTNTTITLSGSGSSTGPNYTYQWTGPGIVSGGNTLTPTVNAPGSYTLTVTNTSNGCTQTATVSVQQNITPPVATATAPPITCNNPSVTINGTGSSTGSNFTYQWVGPGIQSGGNTLNPTVNQPGNYSLTVTNSDNGCTASTTVNVPNQTQLPTAVATSPPITCSNPMVVISGAGSSTGSNFTYLWTGPGIVSGANTLFPTVNQPGNYILTITNTTTGCVNSTSVNVQQNTTPPIAEAGPTFQLDCGTTFLQLNGAGSSSGSGFTYLWTGPGVIGGGNTLTPTVNQPGTYNLTVTNTTNGCTATDQVIVTQDITPPIAVVASPPTITCAVTQVQLNGAGSSTGPNFAYNWTTVGGVILSGGNTLTPTVGAGGLYTLTVTNTNNDCTASFPVVVPTNLVPPVATAGPVQELTCVINQVQLIGAGSSSGNNFTYQWTTPNGNIVSGGNTLFPIVNAPGSYTLTVTNTTNGCTTSASTSVIVDENVPIANAGPPQTITCIHPVVTLNGTNSSSGPNFTFLWTTTNGNIVSGANTLNPLVNLPGQYQLTVTSLANGCQSSSFVTVDQNITLPSVVIAPPDEVNCFNPQVVIDASASSNQGNFSYTWNTANGNIVSGQGTLLLTVDQGGTYILTIVNTTTGCINGGGVTVPEDIVNPTLLIAPPDIITCADPEVTLNAGASATGPNYVYTWTTPDGEIVSGANTLTPVVSSIGTYQLNIYNQSNNCSSDGQVVVTENVVLPTIALAPPQELNCTIEEVQLNATLGNGSNLDFTWSSADGNFTSGQTTLHPMVDAPGTYVLDVVNPATGCASVDQVVVSQDILVPQAAAGGDEILTCAVTQLQLDGTASDSGPSLIYQWTTPDGNIVSGANTTTPQIDAPGTYTLQVYNVDNTCASSDEVWVDEDVVVPVAAAAEPILMGCLDPVITLDGTASTGGTDIVYGWTTANGNILSGENTLLPEVDAPGLYTLTVLDTFNGCFSSTQLTVVQDTELPVVDAGPGGNLTCTLVEIQLQATASGNTDRFEYLWTTDEGNVISGQGTLSPVVNEPGQYTIVVTDTINNCTAEAMVEITQDVDVPVADVAPSNPYNCVFPTVTLDGTGSSQGPNYVYTWSTPNGNFLSGTETLTPIVDMPGTYTLTINDTINFCVTNQTVQILPDTVAPALSIANPQQLNCYHPEISLSASAGGLPNISIDWSTQDGNFTGNETTLNPSVDAPGTYVLSVLNNSNGCSTQTQTVVDSDFAVPLVDAGPDGIINCADTVLTLSGSGNAGGAPMDFLWTTADGNILSGGDTPNPMVDQGGTYLLTLTNVQNGCPNDASVEIVEDLAYPVADAGPQGLLNCYNPQIQLDGSASSSGSEFAYLWTTADGNILNGATSGSPEVDGPGTYVLTITNTVNHCVSSNVVLVTDDFVPPLADAGPGSELTCSLTSIALSGDGSPGSNFTYTWTTTDGNIQSGANTLSPVVDAAGLYALEVFNQDNGCSTTDEVVITTGVSYPAAVAGSADPLTCAVPAIQLDGAGSDVGANFVYSWMTADGNVISGGNTLTPLVNQPGTYTLVVTNTNNDCVTTDEVVVPIDTIAPLAEAGPQDLLTCTVTQLQLNGNGSSTGAPYSYQWSTGNGNILSGATSLVPVIDMPGTYQLLVTNQENGCASVDNVVIGQDVVSPNAVATTPGILTCAVPVLILDGTESSTGAIFGYTWTTPDGNILAGGNTLSPQVDEPGQYILTVLNTFNGCSTTTSLDVLQNIVAPVVEAGSANDLTCVVTTLQLNGIASGNSTDLIYAWTTPDGNIISGANLLDPVIDQPGTYLLTVTDQENGCVTSDQVLVQQDIVPPSVVIANPGQLTCDQETVMLNALSSDSGSQFAPNWVTPNGNILSGGQTLMPVVDQPGTYALTILNGINGCTATGSVQVSQDIVAPTVDAGDGFTLPCFEDVAYLSGSASASTNNLQLLWTTSDGQILTGGNTLAPAISSAGTYQLFVTNLYNGCSASDEVVVTENVPANPDYVPGQPLCYGDNGQIQILGVLGGTPPYIYSIDGGNTFQSTPLFINLTPGTYTIVVQDALGCETAPETQTIVTPVPVEISLEGIIQMQLGESVQLQALVNLPEENIQLITWWPATGLSCTDCLAPIASPLQSTTYQVEVMNDDGCLASAAVQILLDKRPAVYIPNIFSPNGDGENDIFYIFAKPEGIREIKSFLVFSRWGETVFEYYHFQPNNPAYGWDGSHRGLPMNPAVFAWFAEIEFIDGRTEIFEGDVTLVR
ncbi:MAG: choice-of-anchor L domain-containing protein [Lewinellaceae bacterium]|nr:choice-of-anchor L domain-containing protein [Lewinellaceae bacterium]